MNSLIDRDTALSFYPSLNNVDESELEASLLRASIYIGSQVEVPNPTPEDIKLAVCMLVDLDKTGPVVKEIARSDYKEVFDTKDPRWEMVQNILTKYIPTDETLSDDSEVRFI